MVFEFNKEIMKLKLPLGACALALATLLSLSACGGGGGGDASSGSVAVASPSQLSYTDNTVGSGAQAGAGKTVNVTYTLWLYSDTAADHKGTQLESGPLSFTIGSGKTIGGFDQGVTGMLVGGKRTVLVPASLAYGAAGQGSVPPNSGLVFEITLNSVQ
jgi:FKBP-type peptidyl-prolyl cis-trans isomerase FkpA